MLALFAPTLLPGGATKGWYANALLHVQPGCGSGGSQ
jgi:hypothetical protein